MSRGEYTERAQFAFTQLNSRWLYETVAEPELQWIAEEFWQAPLPEVGLRTICTKRSQNVDAQVQIAPTFEPTRWKKIANLNLLA